jgi:PadR family transcriptional regulator PadR
MCYTIYCEHHYEKEGGGIINTQLKKGALELCVLALLYGDGDRYGYELVRIISEEIEVTEGTVYPLLKRLRENGLIESYLKDAAGSGPARKYYTLTYEGSLEKLRQESEWRGFCDAMENILKNKNGAEKIEKKTGKRSEKGNRKGKGEKNGK